jgi:Lon protease-like protein
VLAGRDFFLEVLRQFGYNNRWRRLRLNVNAMNLPLFPLQVVMLPGARLPLHIFEERYRVLINECVREEREFGITLSVGSGVSTVGCSAVVASVLKRYPDGRIDVIVEGRRRFRIQNYETGSVGYLVGEVEFLAVENEPINRRLADETIRLYNSLVEVVYKNKIQPVEEGTRDFQLSFLLAQKAGMDLPQRQRLLETGSENKRLKLLRNYLAEVVPKLTRASEIERVIGSDGYLPRNLSTEDE